MDENSPLDRTMLMTRLATLRGEYSSGRRMLGDLEVRTATLREQLLRIGGAIQLLEELLHDGQSDAGNMTTADRINAAP